MPAYDFKVSAKVSGNPAAKWCCKCGRVLETASFHYNKTTGDGLNARCKFCQYEYDKAYFDTPNGKAAFSRYRKSNKGKTTYSRYNKSQKGKARNALCYQRKKLLQFIADMM